MINNNRIVPVQRIDLLSLYVTMLKMAGHDFDLLSAATIDGQFEIPSDASGALFANQPVKSVELGTAKSLAMYFVADYSFSGFTADGVAVPVTGDDIVPDACTLYYAASDVGGITITNVMTGDPISSGGDLPVDNDDNVS